MFFNVKSVHRRSFVGVQLFQVIQLIYHVQLVLFLEYNNSVFFF